MYVGTYYIGVTHLETTTIPLLLLWQTPNNKNISCPHTQNNSIYSYKATCRGLLYVRGGWWPAIILLWRWRFFENRDASQIQGSDESFNLPGSRSVRLIIPEAAAIMHRVSGFDVRCQDCIQWGLVAGLPPRLVIQLEFGIVTRTLRYFICQNTSQHDSSLSSPSLNW